MDYLKNGVNNMEKVSELKESKYKDVGLVSQITASICTLMFCIMYIVSRVEEILDITGFTLVLLMVIMAFNNHMLFKRKYFTAIYIIVGIFSLAMSLINYFL